MIFTLMAASGISPYDSWKKMRNLSFLPTFKKEADEVVRQVEVLGKDPLTVMQQRGEATHSKLYRNFLGGFVSSVRSGGKLTDYMKSQLKSIFELRYINLNRSIEKIATLVEAYSVMLIVVLMHVHSLRCFLIIQCYGFDVKYFNLDFSSYILLNSLYSHACYVWNFHFNGT